jgi:single-strand DNA-binding protein
MSFEVEGKLYKIYPAEQKTASFQTREFALEIMSGNYPQYIKFQLTQDKCSLVEGYNVGDAIKVSFDLRGREWQDKIFSNLNAWRIESVSGNSTASAKPSSEPPVYEDPFAGMSNEPIMPMQDDLPF